MTRDEMGKALWLCSWAEVPNADALWDTHPNNMERQRYIEAAARFATWLRAHEPNRQNAARAILLDAYTRFFAAKLGIDCEHPDPRPPAIWPPPPTATDVVCPRCSLVLTHPEDIERRYCGHCREFI